MSDASHATGHFLVASVKATGDDIVYIVSTTSTCERRRGFPLYLMLEQSLAGENIPTERRHCT